MLELVLCSECFDEFELADEGSEEEGDGEGNDGADDCVDEDVDKVLAEVLLLEVVPPCEDHGGQQAIEEDLLVELEFLLADNEVHEDPEDEADDDAEACFVEEVPLGEGLLTFLCSRKLPMKE